MLDKKSIQIIKYLINEEETNLAKLVSKTSFSKKQLLYSFEHINEFLAGNNQSQLMMLKENIILTQENKQFLINCFVNGTFFDYYLLDANERSKYLFFMIFNKSDYLSISDFLASLTVSKSTIMTDIKKLQAKLSQYHITINNDRNVGYYLSGDESRIRYLAMLWILGDLASDLESFFYDYFFFNEGIKEVNRIRDIFSYYALEKYHMLFTDKQLTEIVYTLAIFYNRLINSEEHPEQNSYQGIERSREFQLSLDVWNELLQAPKQAAVYFLTSWILTFATVQIDEETFDKSFILHLVNKVVGRFKVLSGIEFYNLEEVEERLYSHFRAVHYRMLYRIPIINQLSQRVKTQYATIFNIVKLSLKEIGGYYDFPIPDEEIAYLTMHFVVAIDDYGVEKDNKKIAAVVCQNGIGSSALVFRQLKQLFPEFSFLGPYDRNSLLSESSNIDMIFSTESNLDLYNLSKEVFIVNPVMTPEEQYNLLRKVYSKFGISRVRLPQVTDLMSIINKNSIIEDNKRLQKELYTYLLVPNNGFIKDNVIEAKPELSTLLTVDRIQTNITISNYEDAIRVAAQPLLENGIIDLQYIDRLIEDYRNGKIMQITEHFCMPHTKGTGNNKLGMSLVVLDNLFEINDNVSVKYILLLSVPKGSNHLLAMNQLLQLLSSKDFYDRLDHFSSNEIHKYIAQSASLN